MPRRQIRVSLRSEKPPDTTSVLTAVGLDTSVHTTPDIGTLPLDLASLHVDETVPNHTLSNDTNAPLSSMEQCPLPVPLSPSPSSVPSDASLQPFARSRTPSAGSRSSSASKRNRSHSPSSSRSRTRSRSYSRSQSRSRSRTRSRSYSRSRSPRRRRSVQHPFPIDISRMFAAFYEAQTLVKHQVNPVKHQVRHPVKRTHTIVKRQQQHVISQRGKSKRPPRHIRTKRQQQHARRSPRNMQLVRNSPPPMVVRDSPPPLPPPIFVPNDRKVLIIVSGLEHSVLRDLPMYSVYDHSKRVWHLLAKFLNARLSRNAMQDLENVVNEMMSGEEVYQSFCGWLHRIHKPTNTRIAITRLHVRHAACSVQNLCGQGAVYVNSWPQSISRLEQGSFRLPALPSNKELGCARFPPWFTRMHTVQKSSKNHDVIVILLGSSMQEALQVFGQKGYDIFSRREPFEELVRSLWEYIHVSNDHDFQELVTTLQERMEAQCTANRINLFETRFAEWEQERRKQGWFFQVVLCHLDPIANAELIQRLRARGAKTCARAESVSRSFVPIDIEFTNAPHLASLL